MTGSGRSENLEDYWEEYIGSMEADIGSVRFEIPSKQSDLKFPYPRSCVTPWYFDGSGGFGVYSGRYLSQVPNTITDLKPEAKFPYLTPWYFDGSGGFGVSGGRYLSQVPNTITDLKPEAYAPQKIGLGPFHHFRQDLYDKMEIRKIAAISRVRFLNGPKFDLWERLLLLLQQWEAQVRELYDPSLDMHGDVLKYVLATDILFLLDFLLAYSPPHRIIRTLSELRDSVNDIMMLENQIPFALLRPIGKFGKPPSSSDIPITERQGLCSRQIQRETEFRKMDSRVFKSQALSFSDGYSDDWLYSSVFELCHELSPFGLSTETRGFWLYSNSYHILDFMYKLIVDRYWLGTAAADGTPPSGNVHRVSIIDLPYRQHSPLDLSPLTCGGSVTVEKLFFLMGKFLSRALSFLMLVKNLPWNGILVLLQYLYFSHKRDPLVWKIKIPSASKLCKISGVRFEATTSGIELVHFCPEQAILQLPVILLETDSEVILRNLVAHEASLSLSGNPLADYFDLMCGIMQTEEDVRVLRERNIIRGSMNDGGILEIFEGIGKTTRGKSTTSNSMQKTIAHINHHFDSRPAVVAKSVIRNFVYDSWVLLVFISSAFLISHLCFKVYGSTPFLEVTWNGYPSPSNSSHGAI